MILNKCVMTASETGLTERSGANRPDADHVVCIAENRASCEPALRILVASLARHSPDAPVRLFAPNATPGFARWIAGFPQVRLTTEPFAGGWDKYEVKPKALLAVLREGARSAVWIDSDIMLTTDFRRCLAGLAEDEIVITEEAITSYYPHDDDAASTRGWGMRIGRVLPYIPNSGVVRVTHAHVALLETWRALLESDEYRAAQALPWDRRPVHCFGDQEVLAALLCSADHAHLPLRVLRRGRDILQYFGTAGFTVRERLRSLRHGPPAFIHSQGYRPWWPRDAWEGPRFLRLYYELSPYTLLAGAYADALEDNAWLRPPGGGARLLRAVGLGSAALTGLPLAVVADVRRLILTCRAALTPAASGPGGRAPAASPMPSSR